MIRTEIRYFFTALMFFTRIPCPSWTDHSAHFLNKSRKYFPLIGWITGGAGALIYLGFSPLLPPTIAIILSMGATVWLTGAFHEDGFADVCDGFGGGWNKEQIMRIMKDSRVGAFGMIGMILLLFLKFFALYELASRSDMLLIAGLINGHVISRFMAETTMKTHTYVQESDKSKAGALIGQALPGSDLLYSFLFVVPPLLLLTHWSYLLALPIAYSGKLYLADVFKRQIGGYTGDCLGAIQQVCEALFYMALLGIHDVTF